MEAHRGTDEPLSRGLVFFPPGTAPALRRRRIRLALILAAVAAALVWPVAALFARPFPLVLGLPLPMAWVVLQLAVVFAALLWQFRADHAEDEGEG